MSEVKTTTHSRSRNYQSRKKISTSERLSKLPLLLCLGMLISGVDSSDYCQINCSLSEEGVHTLCQHPTTDLGPACTGYDKEKSVLSQERKDALLDAHNKYRSTVAMGQETRGDPGPQPSSSDMRQLTWDTELEMIAQRFALQCVFEHDQCRDRSNGEPVGQNLGFKVGPLSNQLSHMVNFYNEVKDVDNNVVDYYRSPPPEKRVKIGHYTQLVWANTHRVGCAVSVYTDAKYVQRMPGQQAELLVCNYAPAGNYEATEVYTKGASCSNCPAGTQCSSQYPGLCAELANEDTRPTPATSPKTQTTVPACAPDSPELCPVVDNTMASPVAGASDATLPPPPSPGPPPPPPGPAEGVATTVTATTMGGEGTAGTAGVVGGWDGYSPTFRPTSSNPVDKKTTTPKKTIRRPEKEHKHNKSHRKGLEVHERERPNILQSGVVIHKPHKYRAHTDQSSASVLSSYYQLYIAVILSKLLIKLIHLVQ